MIALACLHWLSASLNWPMVNRPVVCVVIVCLSMLSKTNVKLADAFSQRLCSGSRTNSPFSSMMQCTAANSIFIAMPLFINARQAALIEQANNWNINEMIWIRHKIMIAAVELTSPPFSIVKICKMIADRGYSTDNNVVSHVFRIICSLNLSVAVTCPAFEW